MFFLQLFPLSLAILWRFLLVFPAWLILYITLSVLTVFSVFAVLGMIPFIGFYLAAVVSPLVALGINAILTMHPYLVGMNIGLRVLGAKPTRDQGLILRASLGYGLLEMAIAFVFSLAILAFWVLLIEADFSTARWEAANLPADPSATLASQLALGAITILSATAAVVTLLVRAALLPTLASAAAGQSPKGGMHRPFEGFGAMFPLMVLLMLLITALSTFLFPLMSGVSGYIGLTQILTEQLGRFVLFVVGERQLEFTLAHAALIVLAILISVWLFCLQCAGAALAHVRQVPEPPTVEDRQELSADMAALRRARMPSRRGSA
ncbi:MAG: hypothetical protein AAFU41_15620 [Pseudomonadota bacterium]